MDGPRNDALKDRLQAAYLQHRMELPEYAWESESARWVELVFCIVDALTDQEPAKVRRAVDVLDEMGLWAPARLAALDGGDPDATDGVVIEGVLRQYGLNPDEAHRAVATVVRAAAALDRDYGGRIQVFLRRYGEVIADALLAVLGADTSEERLRFAVAHWLQNALGMPVTLAHPAVVSFCRRSGATLDDLVAAADSLDLTVALIDDLLALDQQMAADAVVGPTDADRSD